VISRSSGQFQSWLAVRGSTSYRLAVAWVVEMVAKSCLSGWVRGCAFLLVSSLCACTGADAGDATGGFVPSGMSTGFGSGGASASFGQGTGGMTVMTGSGGAPAGTAGMAAHMMTGSGGSSVGAAGSGGMMGSGGSGAGGMGSGGMTGSGGSGTAGMGSGGMTGSGGASGANGNGETGRLIGMTAAHNAVRAMVDTTPALPPVTWSTEIAAFAQDWADMLATSCDPQHRDRQTLQSKGYGENLAASFGSSAPMTTAEWAVDGWAAEVACWTYGTINDPQRGGGTEKCEPSCYQSMMSDGCGHYTQIVWRDSTQIGCGFSTCTSGGLHVEIWICNYAPAGNFVGEAPY
jgi:pathogenesis-related protein 1